MSALDSTQVDEPDFLGRSYLAVGPGGRPVVLKPLDADCLLPNGLHPNIRERLARVRELALGGVANLYGVERGRATGHAPVPPSSEQPSPPAAAEAWLIWEHVPGRTLTEWAADPACTPRRLAAAARELVLGVEALHRLGIVHGAIRGANAVVDARGGVRLTHVSPLLYTNPGDDVWGVLAALDEAADAAGEAGGPLAAATAECRARADRSPTPGPDAVLREFAARLADAAEAPDRAGDTSPPAEVADAVADAAPGRRSLAAAALVTLAGGAAAVGGWLLLRRPGDPAAPAWVQSLWDAWR